MTSFYRTKSSLMRVQHHYCVILAGGKGSRFWPLSNESEPKQFIDVLGIGKSFIRLTFERLLPLFPVKNFFVMTAEAYKDKVLEQLPELNPEQILTEPSRRNTAPCITYAAYKIKELDKDAVMLVTPSDHYVSDEKSFRLCLARLMDYAERSFHLLTVGIKPVYPAIGYGYIEYAPDEYSDGDVPVRVKRFKEKPCLKDAMHMLSEGGFLWNSGIFVWKAQVLTDNLEKYLPEVAEPFSKIKSYNTANEHDDVAKAFLNVPAISIDYGLMEKAEKVLVTKGEFGWSDLGTWESLYKQLEKDEADNAISAESKNIKLPDSANVLVKSVCKNKQIVIQGLNDYLVVDTPETLLICKREDEALMHKLLNDCNKNN